MDIPQTALGAFHLRLDQLVKLVRVHIKDLEDKALSDDAKMKLWVTAADLSARQIPELEAFQTWVDSKGRLPTPVVGAASYSELARNRHLNDYGTKEIRDAFIRCREAAGYESVSDVPRKALKAFERMMGVCLNGFDKRLFGDWPRIPICHVTNDVKMCCVYFEKRELAEIIALSETDERWWQETGERETSPVVDLQSVSHSHESGTNAKKTKLLTIVEISKQLASQNLEYDPKTLNNKYKKQWGNPDGLRGRAFLYDWSRIQPILKDQFGVEFPD